MLFQRVLQLIADPAPNPLLVHHIAQSHVQFTETITAPQNARNGSGETTSLEAPDETARGASVVLVWCAAMIRACLGCGVCWSAIVVAWDARPQTKHVGV